MRTDDVFQTVEQAGGGSLVIPPGASAECTERIIAEDTPGRGCPHDDLGLRPRTGMIGMPEDGVPTRNIESPYGGGVRSLPGATGNCLPAMCSTTPVSSANGPQLGFWRVVVVRSRRPLQGMLPDRSFPVPKQIGNGRLTCLMLLEMFVQRSPPSWCSELCWPHWPVFKRGEDTGTVRAYGSYTD